MNIRKGIDLEDLVGKIVLTSMGEVLEVLEVGLSGELIGRPYLIDGGRIETFEITEETALIVYERNEARLIFAAHIMDAEHAGLWSEEAHRYEEDDEDDAEIQFNIPRELFDKLEAEATRRGISTDSMIDTCLADGLAHVEAGIAEKGKAEAAEQPAAAPQF